MPLPPLRGIDEPEAEGLPRFVEDLAASLARALDAPPPAPVDLSEFGGAAAFDRVEALWRELLA